MDTATQKLIGMKDLGINESDVSAVIIGFTPDFSFYDILLANVFLQNPQSIFLQEAPDNTFLCQSDCGRKLPAPCRSRELSFSNRTDIGWLMIDFVGWVVGFDLTEIHLLQPDSIPTEESWTLDNLKFKPISLNPDVGAVIAGFDIHISFNKEPSLM